MLADLEILNLPADPLFFCPGESVPITQAVHHARQAAHWSGCQGCPSQNEDQARVNSGSSAVRLRQLILRTNWGVRGAWQNGLTRDKAARLISVVTAHVLNQRDRKNAPSATDNPDDPVLPVTVESPTFVMGYDGRPSSPDIYAELVSATLQNGCHVIEVGRSTPASIQETCRSVGDASLSIIATGAGESSSFTGFDVFDVHGQPVSIPWQSYDVSVRRFHHCDRDDLLPEFSERRDAITRLKQSIQTDELNQYPAPLTESQAHSNLTCLELSDQAAGSAAKYRISRRSGRCRSVDAESSYREWIQKWFPQSLDTTMICVCFDPLIAARLEWLFTESNSSLHVIRGVESRASHEQISQRVRETQSQWGICIEEDDRYMTVANQYGRCLSNEQLSAWINEKIRTIRPHITTHVPAGENRIVMLDAGRPNQADACEILSDSMMIMGCICQIIQSGSSLPRPA